MTYDQLVFIIRLMSLHKTRISTKAIQWLLAYIIDYDSGMGSYAGLSRYLGFNKCYYSQCVKKMLLRIGGDLGDWQS